MRRLLPKFRGLTISRPEHKHKTGLDEALEDVRAGRVYHVDSVENLFDQLNS